MARPLKDNADYFTHDKDMRNDPKIKALRRKHSHIGYAVYNYMLELLTDSNNFETEWSELNIEIIAGDFDIEPEILKEIINYCSDVLKLFTIENELIWCNTLRKRFEPLLSKRKRDRNRVIDSENTQSKVKYSKVKKSIEENSKVKTFTAATEILKFLNELPEEKINEMKELTLFSGNFKELKEKFAVEFISRYGLNKTEKEVLETLQSWMHKDKNYVKKEGFSNNKTNNSESESTKIPSDTKETEW